MAGYVIVEVEITNRAGYGEFLEKVTSTVEAHGGKFVVRGGDIDVIEGNWIRCAWRCWNSNLRCEHGSG